MHFVPILSTLRRHRTAAALLVLEIAFTCAIVCNAIFLIGDRVARMDRPSGIVEDEIVRVHLSGIGTKADEKELTIRDLEALRAIPGVKRVVNANMVPFGGSSWNNSASTIPDDPNPPINCAIYMGSADLVETFGVELTAGHDFTPDQYIELDDLMADKAKLGAAIITRGVADRLFPGGNPLGKPVYVWGKDPTIVVGVIDRLARPNDLGGGPEAASFAMILPVKMPFTRAGNYVLRVDPQRKAEVLAAVDGVLAKNDKGRIILDRQTFAEVRRDHFKSDRAMAWLLVGVSLALLVITALGVVGLASFWVQQRTRQIGIRRALGATRGDILRYFQTENFILATMGIVLGMALAYGLNLVLMSKYEVARLPGVFLPIGAVLLWLLGQIAVLGPAMRASLIPPAIATRSV